MIKEATPCYVAKSIECNIKRAPERNPIAFLRKALGRGNLRDNLDLVAFGRFTTQIFAPENFPCEKFRPCRKRS